jgi:hypothetical protein
MYFLAGSWGYKTKPSTVLATRHNRLPTLTFSRSSGFKNTLPQILYHLQAKTGQSHTMCTLSCLSCPHSRHSCPSVSKYINKSSMIKYLIHYTCELFTRVQIGFKHSAVLKFRVTLQVVSYWTCLYTRYMKWLQNTWRSGQGIRFVTYIRSADWAADWNTNNKSPNILLYDVTESKLRTQ